LKERIFADEYKKFYTEKWGEETYIKEESED
jgi:hypothetical protein